MTTPMRPLDGTTLQMTYDRAPAPSDNTVFFSVSPPPARIVRTIADTLRALGEACGGLGLVSLHLDFSVGEAQWTATHETACCNGVGSTAYEAMFRLAHLLAIHMVHRRAMLTAFAADLEGL